MLNDVGFQLCSLTAQAVSQLADGNKENQSKMAEAGAIPPLVSMVNTPNASMQANAAVAILVSGEPLDLLISDVGLPGMNGRQLADIARQLRPTLRVLFMTGYAEQAASSGFLDKGMDMISKPFTIDLLATRIRAMLAQELE